VTARAASGQMAAPQAAVMKSRASLVAGDVQRVELSDQVAEDDRAVAGHGISSEAALGSLLN
jgi:hypothetical protein